MISSKISIRFWSAGQVSDTLYDFWLIFRRFKCSFRKQVYDSFLLWPAEAWLEIYLAGLSDSGLGFRQNILKYFQKSPQK